MIGKFFYQIFECGMPVSSYGRGNGAWNVVTGSLTQDSVVVSVGVGHDISFDLGIVEKYGCRVLLFDPSPTGKATIERHQPLPTPMLFYPIGLASRDGCIAFADPSHPDEGSFRLPSAKDQPDGPSFPCCRLETIMNEQKLDRIDLLKIDIEGFEYGVLDDLLAAHLNVRQICVEFHHRVVPGISRWRSLLSIIKLRQAGYHLVNHDGLNHTLFRI